MKVVALAARWLPGHNAGAEVMLHGMLRALAARGHDVQVRLTAQGGESYTIDGVRVIPAADRPDLRERLAEADVIVTHLECTPAATLNGKWHGVPVAQVLHNTMRITREWLVREPVALAVCNSDWMRADFAGWCAKTGREMPRSIVVRPPVDPAEYRTTPGDRVTLVNLRRMEANSDGTVMGKGSEVFWELAARLPKVQFLAVKGAYGTQDVRDLPNVEVVEHVPHHRMRDEIYARTRVLLMPSSYESWGRTAVEAMCSGIPVVAHPTPGLREALGRRGLFAERDDLDLWANWLRALAEPRAYAKASAFSLARVAELDPAGELAAWCNAVESLTEGSPAVDGTPIDLEKMRSLAVIGRRSGPVVTDGRRPDGVRTKTTTDELGNRVTEHAKGDRQDVLIKAPTVQVTTATREVRD